MIIRATAAFSVALALAVGCGDDVADSTSEARRGPLMRYAGAVGAIEMVPWDAYVTGSAGYGWSSEWPAGLLLDVDAKGSDWEAFAEQRRGVPLGTRYLDADDIDEWVIFGYLRLDDDAASVPYAGFATTDWMFLDLSEAYIYVTLEIELKPVEAGAGPTVRGRVDGWGFINRPCPDPPSAAACAHPNPPTRCDHPPDPVCEAFRADLKAAPVDRDAPPPPFDRRDVIDCTVGEPCAGLGEPAPWPGPPRPDAIGAM